MSAVVVFLYIALGIIVGVCLAAAGGATILWRSSEKENHKENEHRSSDDRRVEKRSEQEVDTDALKDQGKVDLEAHWQQLREAYSDVAKAQSDVSQATADVHRDVQEIAAAIAEWQRVAARLQIDETEEVSNLEVENESEDNESGFKLARLP